MAIARRHAAFFTGSSTERERIAHEAVARAWESRGRFDASRSSLESWLFGIVRNTAREAERDRRRQRDLLQRLLAVREDQAESAADEVEDREWMHRSISRLARREQEVIYLRYWRDLPYSKTALRMSTTESTCRQLAKRAVTKLGRLLR